MSLSGLLTYVPSCLPTSYKPDPDISTQAQLYITSCISMNPNFVSDLPEWTHDVPAMIQIVQDICTTALSLPVLDIRSLTCGFKDLLGEGGYGGVYSCKVEGTVVAVKKQCRYTYANALKEIAIMSTLDHSNIEKVLGICFTTDASYFSMQLRKTSLHRLLYPVHTNSVFADYIWVKNQPRPYSHLLSLERRRHIGKQLLKGLQYIHSMGVIHADIKPGNILLDNEDRVKISDFGISTYSPLTNTREEMIPPCTSHYRPIEHLTYSCKSYGYEVDMWACGLVLMEMEVGCHPINSSGDPSDEYMRTQYLKIFGKDGDVTPKCLGVSTFASLCMSMIRYDPSSRTTASEAYNVWPR